MNKYKWQSRRFLVTLWAMLLSTFIVVFSLLFNSSVEWIALSLNLLIAIPSVYIAGDSLTKKHESDILSKRMTEGK